MEEPFVTVR